MAFLYASEDSVTMLGDGALREGGARDLLIAAGEGDDGGARSAGCVVMDV
jgi:hypothetical protein